MILLADPENSNKVFPGGMVKIRKKQNTVLAMMEGGSFQTRDGRGATADSDCV